MTRFLVKEGHPTFGNPVLSCNPVYMGNNIQIYQTKSGEIKLRFDNEKETFWASKQDIAEIFGVDRSVISRHINNLFKQGELQKEEVCAVFAHTTKHGAIKGKNQTIKKEYYNLDVILAVGYRVNSTKAINFRIWATKILKEYITKGFVLNEKKLIFSYCVIPKSLSSKF